MISHRPNFSWDIFLTMIYGSYYGEMVNNSVTPLIFFAWLRPWMTLCGTSCCRAAPRSWAMSCQSHRKVAKLWKAESGHWPKTQRMEFPCFLGVRFRTDLGVSFFSIISTYVLYTLWKDTSWAIWHLAIAATFPAVSEKRRFWALRLGQAGGPALQAAQEDPIFRQPWLCFLNVFFWQIEVFLIPVFDPVFFFQFLIRGCSVLNLYSD